MISRCSSVIGGAFFNCSAIHCTLRAWSASDRVMSAGYGDSRRFHPALHR